VTFTAQPALVLSGVSRTFPDGTVALQSIDLRIDEGELVSIVGPSGCEESTLLRIVAGLDRPSAGAARAGLLDAQVMAAHCVWMDDDVRLLKSHGVVVAHNPVSNMILRPASAPYHACFARDYGSDWAWTVPRATTARTCSKR
jgi:ABC-type phosphate/phosphonate transport system ATPase subunit